MTGTPRGDTAANPAAGDRVTQAVTASDLNRHLFIVDNYRLLRGLPSGSIDLITTDPPFAKNGTLAGKLKPPLTNGSPSAGIVEMLR